MKFKSASTSFIVVAFLLFGFAFAVLITVMFVTRELFLILFMSAPILMFAYLWIRIAFLVYIIINEDGVHYKGIGKRYFIGWDDIKIVGATTLYRGVLYFATDGIPRKGLKNSKSSNEIIVFPHRKKIERAIRLYWKERIEGLDE